MCQNLQWYFQITTKVDKEVMMEVFFTQTYVLNVSGSDLLGS